MPFHLAEAREQEVGASETQRGYWNTVAAQRQPHDCTSRQSATPRARNTCTRYARRRQTAISVYHCRTPDARDVTARMMIPRSTVRHAVFVSRVSIRRVEKQRLKREAPLSLQMRVAPLSRAPNGQTLTLPRIGREPSGQERPWKPNARDSRRIPRLGRKEQHLTRIRPSWSC